MDTRYTQKRERRSFPTGEPAAPTSKRKGPRPRANARVNAVTVKLSAAQVAEFEAACAAAGLPRSKAGAVAIVRWTRQVLAAG
jgi:hypothetical protein